MLGKASSAFRKSETVWSKSETSQVKSTPSYFTLETSLGRLSPRLAMPRWRHSPRGAGSASGGCPISMTTCYFSPLPVCRHRPVAGVQPAGRAKGLQGP